MKRISLIIAATILVSFASCDSMINDKSQASQNKNVLLLFGGDGTNDGNTQTPSDPGDGQPLPETTPYSITGKIASGSTGIAGITVAITASSGVNASVVTDQNGGYSYVPPSAGDYTITPSGSAYHIYPPSKAVQIDGKVVDVNFSAGAPLWLKTYGTGLESAAFSSCRTPDMGYLIAGYGDSQTFGIRSKDGRIIKIDAGGNVVWDKYYGGTGKEEIHSIIETADSNFVAAGYTASKGNGKKDAWVIKIDPDGVILWDKTFGGANDEIANSIIQNSSGGYVFTGTTNSPANNDDAYVVGLDAFGNVVFEKQYGGSGDDTANALVEADPGTFVIAGASGSSGSGNIDSWAFKIDSSGAIVNTGTGDWYFYYDKTGNDSFSSIIKDGSGGFIAAGYSTLNGLRDFRIVHINSAGAVVWDNNAYGNSDDEVINSLCATPDGGYLAAGRAAKDISYGDVRIFKIDGNGIKQWQKTYGGPDDDAAYSVIPGYDGSFIVAGYMTSDSLKTKDFLVINVNGSGEYSVP